MSATAHQLHLLHHALGVTPDRREPYRNHFVAGPGHHDQSDLEALEAAEMMQRRAAPAFCEPGDVVFYCTDAGRAYALDNLPLPPKRSKYDEYLDADYGHSFAEWLGINLPREDYHNRQYRYTRYSYRGHATISGDWKPTKKEAKASYKAALKAHNDQLRAWRKGQPA